VWYYFFMSKRFRRISIDTEKIPPVYLEKWNDTEEIFEEGFSPLPKKVLRALPHLFPSKEVNQLVAMLSIIDYNRKGIANPSNNYLAFLAGISDEDFLEAIQNLMEKGYLANQEIGTPEEYVEYDFNPFIKKVSQSTTTKHTEKIAPK